MIRMPKYLLDPQEYQAFGYSMNPKLCPLYDDGDEEVRRSAATFVELSLNGKFTKMLQPGELQAQICDSIECTDPYAAICKMMDVHVVWVTKYYPKSK